MTSEPNDLFKRNHEAHRKHLRLKGLQPATIRAYSRAIERVGAYFGYQIDELTPEQRTEYFADRLKSYSWSSVKHDLYGLMFYYQHVLRTPWVAPGLIKPPRAQRLPDIVTVEEADRLFMATRVLSYRTFFFTLYSLGLRIGEGLRLRVGDIDTGNHRVHVRCAKGNKDRFVPLPEATLVMLRRFWASHRNPVLLFPNRAGGRSGARHAVTPLDRAGVAHTLRLAAAEIGLKKRSRPTACGTLTRPI